MNVLSIWDLVLPPIYLAIFYFIASWIKRTQIQENPHYKYFLPGLFIKLAGAIAFCLVYTLYYNGGDTTAYFVGVKALINNITNDFQASYDIIINNNLTDENWASFNEDTGFPQYYMWKDPKTFSVTRFTVPFGILGAQSFVVTSLFTAAFSFIGTWKIYGLYSKLFPEAKKALAFCCLFIPSAIFWTGGIMKDSYVLGATCWLSYNFYQIFINRKKVGVNAFLFIMNAFLIISIKPYVILSLLPGLLLWLNSVYIVQTRSQILKLTIIPILGILIGTIGYFSFENIGSLLGDYGSIDAALEKAKIIQEDLLREEAYGSNSYNLGELDGSLAGTARLAPLAIFTTLYRPLMNEIGSPMMVISALENTFLLLFTVYILFRTNLFSLFRNIMKNPIILYGLFFSILLAFGVGIAGTNFGALVRYKTPLLPFFFSSIYLLYFLHQSKKSS